MSRTTEYHRVTLLVSPQMYRALGDKNRSAVIRRALAQYLNLPEVAVKRGRPREPHE